MPAFTTNQWAILLLVLILGWLLGLASRSGGAKWRREYERERDAHVAYRNDQEARIAAANARVAELEKHSPLVGAGTAGAVGAAAAGMRDDLTQIRGIDRARETALGDAGVHSFRDVEALSTTAQAALEGRLGLAAGTIKREFWPEQAALLRAGRTEEWRRQYG